MNVTHLSQGYVTRLSPIERREDRSVLYCFVGILQGNRMGVLVLDSDGQNKR